MNAQVVVPRVRVAIQAVRGLREPVTCHLPMEAPVVGLHGQGKLPAHGPAFFRRRLETTIHELLVSVAGGAQNHDLFG